MALALVFNPFTGRLDYVSTSGGGSSWVMDYEPTGTVDGVNTEFDIPAASEVVVYADGLRIISSDYSLGTVDSTTTITFDSGKQPYSSISVDYVAA